MKWVAIALALLLLASGIFWLGRTTTPSDTPAGAPAAQTETPEPAKTAAPAPEAAAPETQAAAPPTAPMDAAPSPQVEPPAPPPPSTPPKPRPKTLAELDTGTLIQRAISAEDRCSSSQGSLDQTGAACAMRDKIEAILNARGFCSSSGSANWQRCAQ
jgi:hypothetical protein